MIDLFISSLICGAGFCVGVYGAYYVGKAIKSHVKRYIHFG